MPGLPSAVLFACTFNSIRSPMAEGILKSLHRGRIFVDSVGVRAVEIDPFAVEVLGAEDALASGREQRRKLQSDTDA